MIMRDCRNCGIYVAKDRDGKIRYVGQTRDLKGRLQSHINTLKLNDHANILAQRYYNKYGEGSVTFEAILNCPEDYLNEVEIGLIEKLGTLIPGLGGDGWNIRRGGECYINEYSYKILNCSTNEVLALFEGGVSHYQVKEFKVRSPDGQIYQGDNVTAFAKFFGLNESSLRHVVSGSRKRCRGWTLSDLTQDNLIEGHRTWWVSHKEYGTFPFHCLDGFAMIYKLDKSEVFKLLRGKILEYEGFKKASAPKKEAGKFNGREKEVKLYHPEHGVVIRPSSGIFGEEFGIERHIGTRLMIGAERNFEGWTIAPGVPLRRPEKANKTLGRYDYNFYIKNEKGEIIKQKNDGHEPREPKIYKFRSRNGQIYETNDLAAFAKHFNLTYPFISRLARNKTDSYFGWTKVNEKSGASEKAPNFSLV